MSYSGGKLRPWFSSGPTERFCRRTAHSGGRRQTENTRARTPVDTGALRESIKQKPVVVVLNDRGERVYESGCETDKDYAAPVEHGSGLWGPHAARYRIRPKNWPDGWLHWVDPRTGRDVYAKEVWHPGAPGHHMFLLGAKQTEAELDSIAREHLLRWAKETERQNRSDWHLGRGRL